MKSFFKAVAFAAAPIAVTAVAVAPAHAQSKQGIAVVDMDEALAASNAYKVAMQQIQVTYKANIDNLNSRKTALEAGLKTKGEAFQAAVKAAGGKANPALQTQYEDLQKQAAAAEQEIQKLQQPIALAQAYVGQQISEKAGDALKAAMTAAKVDLVLKAAATEGFQPYVNISSQVTAELNKILPSVGIVPPANWKPGDPLTPQAATSR